MCPDLGQAALPVFTCTSTAVDITFDAQMGDVLTALIEEAGRWHAPLPRPCLLLLLSRMLMPWVSWVGSLLCLPHLSHLPLPCCVVPQHFCPLYSPHLALAALLS